MEKLNSITDERLVEIAKEMKQIGNAGYQEALIDEMKEDIADLLRN